MSAIFTGDIYYLVSFFAAIFAASFAIPTGAIIVIVSFASVAGGWSDFLILILLSLAATISGDYGAYWVARYFRRRFNSILEEVGWMKNKLSLVEKLFDKYASHTVFLTRFLFGMGPYVNFFSGLRAMPRGQFLKAVVLGELVYCLFYILIGYVFHETWQTVIILVRDYSAFIAFTVLGMYIVYRIIKLFSRNGIKK
ncbi:MAG: VTT domain-containing protein [Parcubacteria group bacterium]|jgi:membrane protein DedA with SNARE-associated domain